LNEIEGKQMKVIFMGSLFQVLLSILLLTVKMNLWVVNSGLHSLENYTFDGNLRGTGNARA
jgi:hypothetical protein